MKIFLKLLSFICGSIHCRVNSEFARRTANVLISESLFCTGLKECSEGFEFDCALISAPKLMKMAARVGIPIKVVSTKGLAYLIYRYRRRTGLMIGAALGFAFMLIAGNFIWEVRLKDADITPKLLDALDKAGVAAGDYIPDLDIVDTEMRFLLENREYSFVAVNVRGTIATVELRERIIHEEEKAPEYSNLIASENGVIVSVEALSGFPSVKVGDAVWRGQLLVSGAFERSDGTTGLVRSTGRVIAECSKPINITVPLKQRIAVLTSSTAQTKSYCFFGKTLTFGDEDFEYSVMTDSFRRASLFGVLRLPFDVRITTRYEQVFRDIEYTYEQAEAIARDTFESMCEQCGGDIVTADFTVTYNEETSSAELTGELVYTIDIALEQPFTVRQD